MSHQAPTSDNTELITSLKKLIIDLEKQDDDAAKSSILSVILNFSSFTPLLHPKKFAELTGLTHDTIQGQIRNDHLPTVKQGRYRMINIVALTNRLVEG